MESIVIQFFTYVDNNKNFKYKHIANVFAQEKKDKFFF